MINPRNAINFFKTPAGAFILFCLVLGGIFFACKRFLPGETKPQPLIYSTKAAAAAASKQTMQTFQNTNYSPLPNLPPALSTADMTSQPTGKVLGRSNHAPAKQEVLPISLFAETPQTEQKQLGKNYAPFGRLIPCELIVTVDSSSIQTPNHVVKN